jgi:glycosyltransferase involved in cell wall biosynthesis
MKILMLTPYLPYPPVSGGQTRSYNLIKKLSSIHEITLFSLIKEEKEKKYVNELEKYCKEVFVFKRSKTPFTLNNILQTGFGFYPFLVIRNLVPEEKYLLAKKLRENKYDLIHAETFYVMPHIPDTKTPILLVDQTIEYLVYKHYVEDQAPLLVKPLFSIDVAKLKYWETKFWKTADRVVAMSDSDRKEMLTLVPGLRVDIVPNGIDINFFSEIKVDNDRVQRVLYVGNFKWLQNVEAAEVLIQKVWPTIKRKVKNAKLWIVGRYITEEIKKYASEDIQITEYMEDIRFAYKKSSVLVAPIEGPGGTRLKILEAMASSLPVVSTPVGVEGLGVVNAEHAFVSESWKGLAEYTVKVIRDKKLAAKIGKNAMNFVKNNYSWDISAKILDGLYKEVVNEKKS